MNREKAAEFVKKNARDIERAIYEYFFEDGDRKNVVAALKNYQNPDGGFGHALEADNWNPASNPIATNDAIITLYRTDSLDDEQMVNDIVRYLSSHNSFDEEKKKWLFALDSNKNHPHAIWWEKDGDGIKDFNPTVSLAAFMVCFGKERDYYAEIVKDAFESLKTAKELMGDDLKCYLLSYELFKVHDITDVIDLEAAFALLGEKLSTVICRDTSKYGVEYVPVPSDFFAASYSDFLTDEMCALLDAERAILGKIQLEDGSFDISWKWYTDYPEQFEQTRIWWKSRITIDKMLAFK